MAITYPLPTLAAQITADGITAPSYTDILNSLVASFQAIYGADSYLEPDSQDGQLLAVFAKAISDANDGIKAAYLSRGPHTALGEGLSSIVKINNILRKVATKSTVNVTLSGEPTTVINNCEVRDDQGNVWTVPNTTIPGTGNIIVTATAKEAGDIRAAAHTVQTINTPRAGWTSVDNAAAATPGQPLESDAELRQRQQTAPALNAKSIFSAMMAQLAAVPGVTDIRIYENQTGAADTNGVPGHSLAVMVVGGVNTAVADAIMDTRSPGVGLFGATTVNRTDDVGQVQAIKYTVPINVPIKAQLEVHSLNGYSADVTAALKQALVDHFNGLPIGDNVYWSRAFYKTKLDDAGLAATYEVNFLKLFRGADPPLQDDVVLTFDEIPTGTLVNVSVTVVP